MAGSAQTATAQPVGPATMGGQAVFTPNSRAGLYNSNQNMPASGGKGGSGQAAPPNMFTQSANAINAGLAGAFNEMGYQPMMITGFGDGSGSMNIGGDIRAQQLDPNAANMAAAQTQQADIERFYNPYTSQVIDTSMQDIERARQMQANQAAAQAQAAGAFGGSRGALMETEIGRNALDQAASTAAQLRSQGFTQAANLAQQDVTRRQQANQLNAQQQLQAMLANQASDLQAQQTGAQLNIAGRRNALDAALANQAAMLGGSAQRLAAGNQLANIGNLGFGQAQSVQQGMQQAGAQQQALQQMLADASKGQFSGLTGFPAQALGYMSQALGGLQLPQNTTTSRQPGLFDYLTLGMMM